MDPAPTPVPVEDIEVGDIVADVGRGWHWRVIEVEDMGPTVAGGPRCYWVHQEQIGFGGSTRRMTYWSGEKLPHIRQATVAETATRIP